MSEFDLSNLFTVRDQTVLITGGGTGLGKAISSAFARNGAKVFILGRRHDVLSDTAKEIGNGVESIVGDLSSKDGVEKIVDQVKSRTSLVDTIVHSAGIAIPLPAGNGNVHDPANILDTLTGVEEIDWTRSNNVNVNAPYFLSTLLIPLLRNSTNPNIIIISSVAGMMNQRANGHFVYGVSKAAAIHMSSMLAGRLHPMKIRVNCICPGLFPSEMTGQRDEDGNIVVVGAGAKAAKRSTIGRPGLPTEIAAPVLLLASRGGMYMNDTCINVDGGRKLVMSGIYDGYRLPEDTHID